MNLVEEDEPFVQILHDMGIESFNPLVPTALNEYATRFATELLADARDYSKHAGRAEIEPEDVKLAVKLSDAHAVGFDAPESVQHAVQAEMERNDLTMLADPSSVLHRYPQDMFMQRAYTFVTGSEAYPQDVEGGATGGVETLTGVQAASGTVSGPTGQYQSGSTTSLKFQTTARTGPKKLDSAPGFDDSDL